MQKRIPDQRIAKLSYAKFEEEFGFKPASKTEQTYFALKGKSMPERLSSTVAVLETRQAAWKQAMQEIEEAAHA